jgi:hypothetical protein
MDADFAKAARDDKSGLDRSLKCPEPSTTEFVHMVAFGFGCNFAIVVLLCVCFTRRTYKFNHPCENCVLYSGH